VERQNGPELLIDFSAISGDDDAMRAAPEFREEFEDANTGVLPMDVVNVRENGNPMGPDTRYEALESLFDRAHLVFELCG
jgi:hypothetical protein